MDQVIVALIVAVAVGLTVRSFIKTYKGESSCGCGGCSCASNKDCNQDVSTPPKKCS